MYLFVEGSGHISFGIDVTDPASIQNALKQATDAFSTPPTIIVNSAGITDDNFILSITNEAFQRVIDVNLKVRSTVVRCCFFVLLFILFYFLTDDISFCSNLNNVAPR